MKLGYFEEKKNVLERGGERGRQRQRERERERDRDRDREREAAWRRSKG